MKGMQSERPWGKCRMSPGGSSSQSHTVRPFRHASATTERMVRKKLTYGGRNFFSPTLKCVRTFQCLLFYLSLVVARVGTEWLRICNHPKSAVHDCILVDCLPMLPYKEYERIKNIP